MPTRFTKLLVSAGVATTCLGAFWLGSQGGNPDKSQGKPSRHVIDGLSVDAALLEIGEVWEVPEFCYELPIQNETGTEVKILDFSVSCGCLAIDPRSLTIPPRGTKTVQLKFDLVHRYPGEVGLARRSFEVDIIPLCKAGWPGAPAWRVRGAINSRMTLNVLNIEFAETVVHGQPPPSRKILATVHVPVEDVLARVESDVVTVQVIPSTANPSQFEVVVTPESSLSIGPFQSKVALDLVTRDGRCELGTILTVAGKVQPEVRVLPARLLLGTKPIGETAEACVVLQAPRNATILVEKIEVDVPDVHAEAAEIDGSPRGRTFRVKQRVTKEGDQTSRVRFFIRQPGRPSIAVPMEVCYAGQARPTNTEATNEGKRP